MAAIILLSATLLSKQAMADCVANEEFNGFFEDNDGKIISIPRFGSCCMYDVCGLQCPEPNPEPGKGYGIAVLVAIVLSFAIGMGMYFLVHGSVENYFVGGRSLPFPVLVMTLTAQSIDSNALLGNVDLSYKYSFWDGAVIPIGLGLSLIINGLFLAGKVNREKVLTLPDIFAKRYGKLVEVIISLATIISFIMLLAGNLVGMGVILAYLWNVDESGAIWISSAIIWSYTVSGGLFSVAYTDVLQGSVGWVGCLVFAYWFMANEEPNAAPPSIGFPGYIYPDRVRDNGICDMYQGVNCNEGDPSKCCYNEALWCPEGPPNCNRYDRGAYPIGDQPTYGGQMTGHLALSPFPNAILWNWATIFILAFGNVAALDFQARCMASKTPRGASLGCLLGGCLTFFIGIPFSFLGSITRKYYGPDSPSSEFKADSCSIALALPTCAEWVPDPIAFLRLTTNEAPPVVGALCLVAIVAASMSTADGAILALGSVMSNNIFRHLDVINPKLVNEENLLTVARISSLPLTLISTFIAAYYRTGSHENAAGATGSLLIVAFDIVLATAVVPLFGAFYVKNPSPRAALVSILGGAVTRIALEFALSKDGSLLLPYLDDIEFLDYGPAASTLPPPFVNATEVWDPIEEQCDQRTFEDFTGVDSLAAPLVSLILFISVQFLEHIRKKPLFEFPGGVGYDKFHGRVGYDKSHAKEEDRGEEETDQTWTQSVEVVFAVIAGLFVIFTVFVVMIVEATPSKPK